jgi:PP-loop superfamily ATP-utilizing enzyme
MKKFISFSGGVESTTMCVLFGDKANAIFSDTGWEHDVMYERIDFVEKRVQMFYPEFKIIRVKRDGSTLPEYIEEGKYFPNHGARFCTRMFKIEPIDKYLKQYKNEGAVLFIGLNYDEIEERTGNHGNLKFISYEYPLVDKKLNRSHCKAILSQLDLLPNFPAYMQRGGCIGCYYKSKKEYEAMVLLNPTEFEKVERLEKIIQDKRDKYFSIIEKKPMWAIKEGVNNMIFNPDEIYPVINNATKCGVFCNR